MELNLCMISFTGNCTNLAMGLGYHLWLLIVRNPFSTNLLTSSRMGADIQMIPVGVLLLNSFRFDVNKVLLLDAVFVMKVPKNFALFSLALVIRVFSNDNSNFRSARRLAIFSFS